MNINAFVGHSFRDEDDAVVRAFVRMLDGIKKIQPRFSWAHAEGPEPVAIDDKVLALFEGKNLFIGICTRRERVIDNSALKIPLFNPSKLAGTKGSFQWKVSDWILQEIGLSIGRRIKVILLVEKDVRAPGQLQGNLEFITFERERPDACYPRLLEMISTLVPPDAPDRAALAVPATAELAGTGDAPKSELMDGRGEWLQPTSAWTEAEYERGLSFAVYREDEVSLKRITESYRASAIGASKVRQNLWDASIEYQRILHHDNGNLSAIQTLAEASPDVPELWATLGRAYLHYREFKSAALAFKTAVSSESAVIPKVMYLQEAALANSSNGKAHVAGALVRTMRTVADGNADAERIVLATETVLAEKSSDKAIHIACLERLSELNPSDSDLRFRLAFAYGNSDSEDMAAAHYERIPDAERGDAAWNNLGVALDALKLPIGSVRAYLASEHAGGTLAVANRAKKLLAAGFVDDAMTALNKAVAVNDHHKNVDSTLAEAKEAAALESDKRDKALAKTGEISEFNRRFGESLAKKDIEAVPSSWTSDNFPGGVLVLKRSGTDFAIAGVYEVTGGLAFAFVSNAGESGSRRFEVVIRGRLHGRTLIGRISRKLQGESKQTYSLLGNDNEHDVLMWVSANSKVIYCCERIGSSGRSFYALNYMDLA